MANLEKRLDALEQASKPGIPTHWRWIIAENAQAVERAKLDHINEHGDTPDAGWIISYLAPPVATAVQGSSQVDFGRRSPAAVRQQWL